MKFEVTRAANMQILVAVRFTLVCRHLIAGISGLNPAEDMDVLLLWLLRVVYVAASEMG
jgi:hypothetical protein